MKTQTTMKNLFFGLSFIFVLPFFSIAQVDLGVGINLRYHMGFKHGSSNFSGSIAIGVSKEMLIKDGKNALFLPTYQLAFNVYSNGLGTNMMKSFRRTEFDIINTFSATIMDRDLLDDNRSDKNLFQFKAFNPMTASAFLYNYGKKSFTLSTSFVNNNHYRNQHVAYLGFNLGDFRMGYYNDGMPFFPLLADMFDRWWTGGVFIQIGSEAMTGENDKVSFKYSYDRFTGDVQDAYKFATRLGLTYVPAKEKKANLFNRGQTSFSLKHSKVGLEVSGNFLGHYKHLDLQRLTHLFLGFSQHVSFAQNFFTIGVEYNKPFYRTSFNLPKS